jgi:hypothetical protein
LSRLAAIAEVVFLRWQRCLHLDKRKKKTNNYEKLRLSRLGSIAEVVFLRWQRCLHLDKRKKLNNKTTTVVKACSRCQRSFFTLATVLAP